MLIQPRQANLPTRSVADLTALAALSVAGWDGSGVCYVETLRCYFFLGALTGALPFEVVTAAGGLYSWYRASAGTAWTQQITWYVDPAAGDDEGEGDVAAPIQTVAELSRRLRVMMRASTTYTFNILGTIPATDTLDLTGCVTIGTGPRPTLVFVGQRTVVRNGSVSAANQSDPANGVSGTQASITDSVGTAWTPGEFVYFADGKGCHVLKDQGGGVARVGHIFTAAATPVSVASRSAAAPATPVDYDVVSMTVWNARGTWSGDLDVIFYNLSLAGIGSKTLMAYGTYRMMWSECILPTSNAYNQSANATTLLYFGCLVGDPAVGGSMSQLEPGTTVSNTLTSFIRFTSLTSMAAPVAAFTFTNCTFQSGTGNTLGHLVCGFGSIGGLVRFTAWISFFDWENGTAAIQVQNASTLFCEASTQIFGDGGEYGVRVRDAGTLTLPTLGNPRLHGTVQDIDLDGLSGADDSATAPMPAPIPGAVSALSPSEALNGANGAGWTVWAAAAPSFNRRAISHLTGAKIFTTV